MGGQISDRAKKAQWWAGVFKEKSNIELAEAEEKAKLNFSLTVASFIGTEFLFARLAGAPEVFYRRMTFEHAEHFIRTGKVLPGTETMISPTLAYSNSYNGVTFQITTKPGTYKKLLELGVRDLNQPGTKSLNLPGLYNGWKRRNAFLRQKVMQIKNWLSKLI